MISSEHDEVDEELAAAIALSMQGVTTEPSTKSLTAAITALQCSSPSALAAAGTIQVLTKLLSNLVDGPSEKKFRTVKLANTKIAKALSCEGALALLLAAGFQHVDQVLEMPRERRPTDVQAAAQAALDALYTMQSAGSSAKCSAAILRTRGGSTGAGDTRQSEAPREMTTPDEVDVGDTVTILNTANVREEFPEGRGKEFVIQECRDGGRFIVQGRLLAAEDLQLRAKCVQSGPSSALAAASGYGPHDVSLYDGSRLAQERNEGGPHDDAYSGPVPGDVVTVLNTENARDEFPEGIGKQFPIQDSVGGGVYVVEGRYLVANDLQQFVDDHDELPFKMVGTWQRITFGDQHQISMVNGTLFLDGRKLQRDGPWMRYDFGAGEWKMKLSAGGNTIVYYQSATSGLFDQTRPFLLHRSDCLTKGAELVVNSHDGFGAHLYDMTTGTSLAFLPAGTRLIASGPPRRAVWAHFEQGRKALIPIKPYDNMVLLAFVRLNEDLGDALQLTSGIKPHKFNHLQPIWIALDTGDTVLLHAKYIRTLASAGKVLPRRQELPADAAWETLQLRAQVELRRVLIVAISYCWLTWQHPDPNGQQLQTLSMALGMRLDSVELPLDDIAIFIDYGSLYQKRRTSLEQLSFDRGLENVTLWYASSEVMVFAMTKPLGEAIPYKERGWPTFEWSISSLQHSSVTMLNLGSLHDKCASWHQLTGACAGSLTPPLAPEEFDKVIVTKRFTNGRTDATFVARKYKETFEEIACAIQSVTFRSVNWGAQEISILAPTLPHFQNMMLLTLSGNCIQAEGARHLARGLQPCRCLKDLYLDDCNLADAGLSALVPVFLELCELSRVNIMDNNISVNGVVELFAVVPWCHKMVALDLSGNPLFCPAFLEIIAVALSQCPRLRQLFMQEIGLEDPHTAAEIQCIWITTRIAAYHCKLPDQLGFTQLRL